MAQLKALVHGPYGDIPLLLMYGRRAGKFRGTVLLYHGLGASKDSNRAELATLADRGFLAVGVDAIAHGERRATDFDHQIGQGFSTMLRWINESAREVPIIVDALGELIGPGLGKVGITGISMGGYITYASALREPRVEALVPILGCPDWSRGGHPVEPNYAETSPHKSPQAFTSKALLALNAGRDENVKPEHSRKFVEQLKPLFQANPQRLEYAEYPDSGHFMKENDWKHLWTRTLEWFERHLV